MAAHTGPPDRSTGLVCQVGDGTVVLPARDVAEVVRVPVRTRVPNAPASLLGVANLRGAVLPVMSLARLLGQRDAPAPDGASARVVVMAGVEPAGLLVDAVVGLSRDGAQPIDLPSFIARNFATFGRQQARRAALATTASTPRAASADRALISLRLADQEYAIPLADVAEIVRLPATLAVLPDMDGAMLGVASIRGASLPVASLRALLGLPPGVPGRSARILVLQGMGVMVDSVGGILTVAEAAIDPVPPVLRRIAATAEIQGICRLEGGRRLVCLLSAAHLVRGAAAQHTPVSDPGPSVPADQVVMFRVGGELYGLPAETVDCVLRAPSLTRLPGTPDFVTGVMTLRGRAIPVIDLSRRFGAASLPASRRRVLVVTAAGVQAGFTVDAVLEVLSVPQTAVQPAPAFGDGPALFARVVLQGGGEMSLLVSATTLLHEAERDMLAAWSAAA